MRKFKEGDVVTEDDIIQIINEVREENKKRMISENFNGARYTVDDKGRIIFASMSDMHKALGGVNFEEVFKW